jgi:glycosyltransferase involved in cell wall biosynthesis
LPPIAELKSTRLTRIGILAVAQQRNGGTLPYTLSMIETLRRLPVDAYGLTIYTAVGNKNYDRLGLPVVELASTPNLAIDGLLQRDPFEAVDKVIAPVYATLLLATRRPFAFTLHDLQEKHFPEHFSLITRGWRHATNWLLTARAKQVICESGYVKTDIVRHFDVPADRIAVIPAPPVLSLSQAKLDVASGSALRAKFNLPDVYCLYPAQFWPHKNHLRLIEAFAKVVNCFPKCGLVLTGQKRLEYAKVMQRAQKLKLAERVFHVGHVDQTDLAALYQGATIVVVPTLFESISLPIYEAFALGIAVCASNVVALPEQVGAAGLLFDPLSPDDIAESMIRLLRSPDLRRQLIERGQARIATLTTDAYAQSLSRVLDKL